MSLPWFSFYTDDYLGNTMHLTTEEHGAYLLLMLAYYRTEKPLPGYDRALAAIAKLPLDRWLVARVAIEPFFTADGDFWRHERIEAEIAERHEKHTKSSEKARKAALAKAAKFNSGHAPSKPQAAPKSARAKREPSSSSPHLHKHTTLSNERVVAAAPNDDARQAVNGLGEGKDTQAPNPLGTTLPETWVPAEIEIACAREYGMNDDDLKAEVLKFHALNAQNGTFSKNWSATWQLWCARFKERQASQPKPRVDVSASASEGVYVPKPHEWERALMRWQRGDQSGWPRALLGPEPGQARCRVPKDLLEQYNIDPMTGLMMAPCKEDS